MSHKRPPVVEGRIPDQRYDLDDDANIRFLGLNPNEKLKLTDQYDHYPDCKWAIIEYKSRSLKDSVEQLKETAKRFSKIQRKVDLAIIIAIKINRAERRIFRKIGNTLHNKLTKRPIVIKAGANRIVVGINYIQEVDRQYRQYERSLMPWVSK